MKTYWKQALIQIVIQENIYRFCMSLCKEYNVVIFQCRYKQRLPAGANRGEQQAQIHSWTGCFCSLWKTGWKYNRECTYSLSPSMKLGESQRLCSKIHFSGMLHFYFTLVHGNIFLELWGLPFCAPSRATMQTPGKTSFYKSVESLDDCWRQKIPH